MSSRTRRSAFPALVIVAVLASIAATPSYGSSRSTDGLLAFQRQAGKHVQIFTVRPDGREQHQVTHLSACDALGPVWSPNGTRLTFACDYATGTKKEHLDIFTMRSNGSHLHALGLEGLNGDPTWMSNSRLIWVQPHGFATSNTDGSDMQTIPVGGDDASPTLSPDGSQIAFLRARPHGARAIYVARADGTHERRLLTSVGGLGDRIGWSPDGTRIGYSSPEFGWHGRSSNVYTVPISGGAGVQLTHESGGKINDGFDSWSPDSKRIAFVSSRSGANEIYAMAADGSGVTRITHGPDSHLASWGRAPASGATSSTASRTKLRSHDNPAGYDPLAPQNAGAS